MPSLPVGTVTFVTLPWHSSSARVDPRS